MELTAQLYYRNAADRISIHQALIIKLIHNVLGQIRVRYVMQKNSRG